MSTMKKRLLTALDRDPDLLYSVYLALLDRKFCGPWVPLKDYLGQPTDRMVREDHLGEVCAWVKQPINPNSFGPEGMYDWSASFIPPDEIDDAVAKGPEFIGTNGFAEDITDAMHAADEALRGAGWVLVPKADWQSPSGDLGLMEDAPEVPADNLGSLMDSLALTMPPEEQAKYRKQRAGMAQAPPKHDPSDPFNMLKEMFKGKA
ncbi:hypothetical protein N9917_00255 [Deltaproteobacteria bacterium]|nr:hypothetical protein [Deltaproteobacteria bacterium]